MPLGQSEATESHWSSVTLKAGMPLVSVVKPLEIRNFEGRNVTRSTGSNGKPLEIRNFVGENATGISGEAIGNQ